MKIIYRNPPSTIWSSPHVTLWLQLGSFRRYYTMSDVLLIRVNKKKVNAKNLGRGVSVEARRRSLNRSYTTLLVTGLALSLSFGMSGCSIVQERTNSPMTTVEQLLLTQAVGRGLGDLTLPLRVGTAVALKSYGYTPDKEFARRLVEGWFLDQGFRIVPMDVAPVTVRMVIHALGTERGESFFGLPPINSVFFPMALPELAIYRMAGQRGMARYQLEITDSKSGGLIHRSPIIEGSVFMNQYTVMLWFTFQRTDLVGVPSL
jgi:hypothetical protein